MYDITTHSVFNTFLARRSPGRSRRKVQLKQASVVTTEWGAWKKASGDHGADRRIGAGRDFDFRNKREADGPIFPIGDVDPRLPVHEDIVGIIRPPVSL